ncbi:MAG: phosphorylase [Methylobacterium sp.]|nr:MAG: phosphorylase [Methylobacterium sp.]
MADPRASVLAICGMASEARLAARFAGRVIVSAADPARLARILAGEPLENYRLAVSFGLCGGLSPDLAAGRLVIADAVVTETAHFAADPAFSQALRRANPDASGGLIAGVDQALTDPAGKAACHAGTGAIAADMESHVMAEACAKAGLPFIILRAVSDDSERALPPLAMSALDSTGRLSIGAVIASLVRQPSQIALLPGLARDSRRAFTRLEAAAASAATLFAGAA